eukprot:335074-Chlamydomonas_euryale.AAC.1
MEMRAAAERNRRAAEADRGNPAVAGLAHGSGGGGDGGGGGSALDAHERRRARLEAERAKREAEIRAFQQQHFREMQEAALRNRAAIQRDIGDNASAAGARAHDEAAAPCARVASGGLGDDADGGGDDFAAMVKDMADLLTDSLDAAGAAAAHGGDADIEEDLADVLAGRFLLNGATARARGAHTPSWLAALLAGATGTTRITS